MLASLKQSHTPYYLLLLKSFYLTKNRNYILDFHSNENFQNSVAKTYPYNPKLSF
jgi:hypothetical protein